MSPFLQYVCLLVMALAPSAAAGQGAARIAQLEAEVTTLNDLPAPDEVKLGSLHLLLAQLYSRAGEVGKARLNADLAKESFSETKPEYLPVVENLRGNLALAAGDQFEALAAFNEGLDAFYWSAHRGLPRPHPDSIHGRQFAEATQLLGNRAALLANSNQALEALLDYELLFLLEDRRRQTLSREERSRYPGQDIRPYYDAAIDMLVTYSKEMADASLLWDAFSLSERAKAYSLLQSVPDNAEQRKRKIEELNERVAALQERTQTDGRSTEAAKLQLDRLLYGREKATFSSVAEPPGRDLLDPLRERGKSLLAFHSGLGGSHLFVIHPAGDSIAHRHLPAAEGLREIVSNLRNLILTGSAPGRDVALLSAAHDTYNKLLGGALPEGDLLILPDGPLHDLPFACLLSEDASGKTLSAKLPWLINGRDIQLAYSSQVVFAAVQGQQFKSGRVRFATRSGPLDQASSYPASQEYTGESLHRELFIARAGEARIVELSVEGVDDPPVSYLQFGKTGSEAGIETMLSYSDITQLDLMNDLLVLNGPATASIPDGTTSSYGLPAAFRLAGVRSVMAESWPLDSLARARITERFYTGLAAGKSGEAALAAAQRSLLARDQFADPVHWAAPVFYGEALTLVPGEAAVASSWPWIAGVAVGFLLVGGLIFRKNRGRKPRRA